ncbi:hypothetical protein J1N35_041229 [Gossypium stocksii]|uniref:Uncharacterized protein n=1 Tax=Gossypium stocksii TaxID=47602 RepID=A0A9D3UF36_9ROSI|nr:hypothetical protein J1N35_041229 [Gossypium stocksii]
MALFFKPNPVIIEPKPCKSEDDASDNAPDPDPRFKALTYVSYRKGDLEYYRD